MTGKLGPDALAEVLAATGADDAAVDMGPAYGEDAAAIDLAGTESTLVVAADPLSLAADAVGELAVHVACNDVARAARTRGGSPTRSFSPTTTRHAGGQSRNRSTRPPATWASRSSAVTQRCCRRWSARSAR